MGGRVTFSGPSGVMVDRGTVATGSAAGTEAAGLGVGVGVGVGLRSGSALGTATDSVAIIVAGPAELGSVVDIE